MDNFVFIGSVAIAHSRVQEVTIPLWSVLQSLWDEQAKRIAALQKANYEKDREIESLKALCEQRGKALNEMEEWIAGFKPAMDENERTITEQETAIMGLKETLNKLINLTTSSVVVASG